MRREEEQKVLDFLDSQSLGSGIGENSTDIDEKLLAQYRALQSLEKIMAAKDYELDEDLSESIVSKLDQASNESSTLVQNTSRLQSVYVGLISLNAALLLVLATFVYKLPTQLNNHHRLLAAPEQLATVALELPVSLDIAKRMSRVDLQVAYSDNGVLIRRELARFIPVVNVQAVSDSVLAKSRVYISVPKSQVRELQLARLFGELEVSPIQASAKAKLVTPVRDPQGRLMQVSGQETPAVLYYRQHPKQSVERLVYVSGAWIPQAEINIEAF